MGVATSAALQQRIDAFARQPEKLIEILHLVQDELSHVPPDMQERIAAVLEIPISQVYGVVTFYHFFRTEPVGEHTIRLCQGTACHVRGAVGIEDGLRAELGISVNQTTEDDLFTLESVRCLGTCALAPVMMVDEKIYGRLTTNSLCDALNAYRPESGNKGAEL